MSQSPLGAQLDPGSKYFDSFAELAERIHQGASFSGRERNCAFLNLGGESFADASSALGLDLLQDSRGIALCDWDHDGDVDFWMSNRTAPQLQLMQNQNAAQGRGSVTFLLVGDPSKRCPVDAAGARVVISAGGNQRVKSVHLGDGFLSQSSRWLHFGLGESDRLDRVVVHWPAGEPEEFEGASAGGRFVLRQGAGKAVEAPGSAPDGLGIEVLELPESSDVARIWLSEPVPLPANLSVPGLRDGPALLNLWASWCAPCVEELKAFAAVDRLPLVPLNIENLDGGTGITMAEMASLLKSLGIETAGGFAEPELVAALNEAIRDRIYRHRDLPLPASFLLDKDRRIRAIYKGSVDASTVLEDLEKLEESEIDPLDAAVPFPGSWSREMFESHPLAVADAFLEGGYGGDAKAYLEKSLQGLGGDDPLAKLRRADLHLKIADINRAEGAFESAIEHYGRALEANPKLVQAQIYLALSLADAGRPLEALQLIAQLRGSAPDNPNFINLEADVHHSAGDDARAADVYREVLAANARYIPAIVTLASILATSSDEEIRDGAEAVKLAEFLSGAPGARSKPQFAIILADAYAEVGRFDRAQSEAERALDLLLPYGGDDAIGRLKDRLELFREKTPYRAEAN